MNAGKFVGHNAQTFYVTFGPKFVSTAVIRVQATSRTDVTLTPGAVAFGTVPLGSKTSQAVSVKYSGRTRDWKLTEVVPPQGPFEVKFAEVSRGGPLRGRLRRERREEWRRRADRVMGGLIAVPGHRHG